MSTPKLEVRCPQCNKRLKAPASLAGKRVKCPSCNCAVQFPEAEEPDDDEYVLSEPHKSATADASGGTADSSGTEADAPRRSVFDDDLPELSHAPSSHDPNTNPLDLMPLGNFDELIAQSGGLPPSNLAIPNYDPPPSYNPNAYSPSAYNPQQASSRSAGVSPANSTARKATSNSVNPMAVLSEPDPRYRVACKTCGTAQYVKPSQQGKDITCPDCQIRFVVPPPPKGWTPETAQRMRDDRSDVGLSASDMADSERVVEKQRANANEILEKAARELEQEEIDDLYNTPDFDSLGFVQRTFGFLKDPEVVAQIIIFGLLFAGIFGLANFAKGKMAQGGFEGGGYSLLLVIGINLVGFLVSLPMLSNCLALIESIANRQPKVTHWPAFSLFDNFGELLIIVASLGGSLLPGILVGGLIGRIGGTDWLILAGMMLTCFLLFPILLLSMLDNGGFLPPVSGDVIRSLSLATESWGAYYVKTLVAFFVITIAWFMLLSANALAASIAGFTFPLLLFFVCQQLGSLADAISEHLSLAAPTKPASNDDQSATDF